ncbi:MAG: helix-turn-helix transcriptional regulator [Flavobacterium sp.]|nr:helix-turn-helix transcriptional regulator [Flavobacterium sp.]
MSVGTKIRKLRLQHKMSQEELAFKLNIAQTSISNLEANKSTPDFLIMQKVCDVFEVDFNYFIEKPQLKQVNKDSAVGYLADNQTFYLSEKIIEQYELRIKEKDELIAFYKSQIK